MNKYGSLTIFQIIPLIFFGSCSIIEGPIEYSNPLDPNDPNFEPPGVNFIQGPTEAEIVDTCVVTFEWDGNYSGMSYSFRIDTEEWSEWSNLHLVEYPLLDEGPHHFEVKSRYFSGVESDDSQVVSFVVDDLKGTALAVFPRYSRISQAEDVEVEIIVHDVTDLAIIKVVLNYNPTRLTVNSVQVYEGTSFLAANGGTVIPFYSIDTVQGNITIDVAVATGSPNGVSGSGGIARINFTSISSQPSSIDFEISSEFRDADNTTIQIGDFGNGGVYAE